MTKEELKQEAEKSLDKRLGTYAYIRKQDCYTNYVDGYIDSAEPREKQIQIDAEQILALQKQNGELTDENERLKGDLELWESGACRATNLDKCSVVKELKAQIEKMKCCPNCDFVFRDGFCYYDKECKNKDHWKLRR